MKNLVVLCGGRSAEHDVSFLSAASILGNLDRSRYRIRVLGIDKRGLQYRPEVTVQRLAIPTEDLEFPEARHWVEALLEMDPPPEVVFPVLHGPFGEDGTVQGVLEVLDIAYVGAGVWGSAVGMNKIQAKRLLEAAGLPVLPFQGISRPWWERDSGAVLDKIEQHLEYPVFVKPCNMGSSVGINRSVDRLQLSSHCEIAFRYDHHIVVERGIDAREIELSVLGNDTPRVSTAGEIVPSRDFYSYEAKYLDDASELLIPAPLTDKELAEVRKLALSGFSALGLDGMARMDFLLDRATGSFWINEPNTIPGFTRISMYPKLWEASGLPYPELLDRLVELGLERYARRSRLSVDR